MSDLQSRVLSAINSGQDLRPMGESEADQLFEFLKLKRSVIGRLMLADPDDDQDAAFTKIVLNYVYLRIMLSESTGATHA